MSTRENMEKKTDTKNGFKTCRTIKPLSHQELRPREEHHLLGSIVMRALTTLPELGALKRRSER